MQRRLDPKDHIKLLLSFMKVVAIATIADAVPLTAENRVFVSLGLDALRKAVNPGLRALLECAQVSTNRPPTSGEVGFRIAPRINAAGRMDVARDVIELFSVKDVTRARELASKLDQLNTERQEEERKILRSVEQRFSEDASLADSYCIVVRRRLAPRSHRHHRHENCRALRPRPLASSRAMAIRRMARAVPSVHSICSKTLESCGSLILPIWRPLPRLSDSLCRRRTFPELRARVDQFARTRLKPADFEPVLDLDGELAWRT